MDKLKPNELNSLLLLNLSTFKTIPRVGKVVVSHGTGTIALDKLSTNGLFDPFDRCLRTSNPELEGGRNFLSRKVWII